METVDELVDSFEFPAVDWSATGIGPATLDINSVVELMVVLELVVGIAVLLIVVVVVVSGRIVVVSRTVGWLTTSVGSGCWLVVDPSVTGPGGIDGVVELVGWPSAGGLATVEASWTSSDSPGVWIDAVSVPALLLFSSVTGVASEGGGSLPVTS